VDPLNSSVLYIWPGIGCDGSVSRSLYHLYISYVMVVG